MTSLRSTTLVVVAIGRRNLIARYRSIITLVVHFERLFLFPSMENLRSSPALCGAHVHYDTVFLILRILHSSNSR